MTLPGTTASPYLSQPTNSLYPEPSAPPLDASDDTNDSDERVSRVAQQWVENRDNPNGEYYDSSAQPKDKPVEAMKAPISESQIDSRPKRRYLRPPLNHVVQRENTRWRITPGMLGGAIIVSLAVAGAVAGVLGFMCGRAYGREEVFQSMRW